MLKSIVMHVLYNFHMGSFLALFQLKESIASFHRLGKMEIKLFHLFMLAHEEFSIMKVPNYLLQDNLVDFVYMHMASISL